MVKSPHTSQENRCLFPGCSYKGRSDNLRRHQRVHYSRPRRRRCKTPCSSRTRKMIRKSEEILTRSSPEHSKKDPHISLLMTQRLYIAFVAGQLLTSSLAGAWLRRCSAPHSSQSPHLTDPPHLPHAPHSSDPPHFPQHQ
jgi:hypothetical protein